MGTLRCDDKAIMKAVRNPSGVVDLLGFTTPNDGNGNLYFWSAGDYFSDIDDVNYISSDHVDSTTGAWLSLRVLQQSRGTESYALKSDMVTSGPPSTSGTLAYMQGYYTINDGGQGLFVWDSSDRSSDVNDGLVFAPNGQDGSAGAWVRILSHFITPEMFGFNKDIVSPANDARFQLALDYMSTVPVLEMSGTYTIETQLNLVRSTAHRLYIINGNGSRLVAKAGTAITLFKRQPADLSEANATLSVAFHINDLDFKGDDTSGQVGLYLGASYMSEINRCHFDNLDIGADIVFGLNNLLYMCWFTGCNTTGLRIRHGNPDFTTGSAAQSNHSGLYRCRFWGPMTRQLEITHSNSVVVDLCIFEGGAGDYCVHWTRGSTTVQQFTMKNTHFETTAAIALCSINGGENCNINLEGLRSQQTNQTIVECLGGGSTCRVRADSFPPLPSGSIFNSDATTTWTFTNAAEDFTDSSRWSGGSAPTAIRVLGKNSSGTSITQDYHSTSHKVTCGQRLTLEAPFGIRLLNGVDFDTNDAQITSMVRGRVLNYAPIIAAGASTSVNVTMSDMTGTQWFCVATHRSSTIAGLMLSAVKIADEQTRVDIFNPTGSSITVSSNTLDVLAVRVLI